ncbi:MAG: type 1 glutamine amidotransferase domain-containing protein [Nanoarchaeota archaeon]|nr:type 1 glutamine amidotransferase domain-containing protein [Nanoarchaeota archaeon]
MIKNKKVLIFAEAYYEDLELWYPKIRLIEEGAKVVVAGTGDKAYKGKNGYPLEVDGNIKDYKAKDFDAVVIPGGWAPDRLRRYKEVLDFVREMHKEGKVIAAICHAGWVLASAGIVKGRKVTCVSAIKDDMINAGAKYFDQEVVVDNNIITSRMPADLPAFCKEIIKALSN